MNSNEFRTLLKSCTPRITYSQLADFVGMSKRQVVRYATGQCDIPHAIATLTRQMVAGRVYQSTSSGMASDIRRLSDGC